MDSSSDRVTVARLLEQMLREERRGQRFFADAVKFVETRPAKILFEQLAVEENRHIDVLQAELSQLAESGGLDPVAEISALEFDGEPITVFNLDDPSMVAIDLPDLELFRAEDFKNLLQDCSIAKILKLAMRVEYDNFKYLVELSPKLRTRAGRRKVLDLAEDERTHFVWLRQHYDKLTPAQRGQVC